MKQLLHSRIIKGEVEDIFLSEPFIFADREAQGRSGHVGHALAEFAPGKIISFCPNTSNVRFKGHAAYGWAEYRISEDYGNTFGELRVLDYSYRQFIDGIYTIMVEKVVSSPDGSLTAFCLRCRNQREICCEPFDIPTYIRSFDGGKTWTEAKAFSPYRGRIYDAVTHKGIIYVLQHCNDAEIGFVGTLPEHVYRVFKSEDNGETFAEVSVVEFASSLNLAYGAMVITSDGDMQVYAYNIKDEKNMAVAISHDLGQTWDTPTSSYVAKRIRNPQIGLLNGQFLLHGRSGGDENGIEGFVLYTSKDGLTWDEGTMLVEGRPASFYSDNLTLTMPDGRQRMIVGYSENYNDPKPGEWNGQVNSMMFFLEKHSN